MKPFNFILPLLPPLQMTVKNQMKSVQNSIYGNLKLWKNKVEI